MVKTRKERIVWTDKEWDDLAAEVSALRLNRPEASFISLAEKAIGHMPKHRQRVIPSLKLLEPLVELVKVEMKKLKMDAEKLKKLKGKMEEVQVADDILNTISDKEAVERFGTQVLQSLTTDELLGVMTVEQMLSAIPTEDLVGATAKRVFQEATQHPVIKEFITATQQGEKQQVNLTAATVALPKVVCLGMLSNQQQIMRKGLDQVADLRFVEQDRNPNNIPANGDWYVIWTRFSSHAFNDKAKSLARPGRCILHNGGITSLIARLQSQLSSGRRIKSSS